MFLCQVTMSNITPRRSNGTETRAGTSVFPANTVRSNFAAYKTAYPPSRASCYAPSRGDRCAPSRAPSNAPSRPPSNAPPRAPSNAPSRAASNAPSRTASNGPSRASNRQSGVSYAPSRASNVPSKASNTASRAGSSSTRLSGIQVGQLAASSAGSTQSRYAPTQQVRLTPKKSPGADGATKTQVNQICSISMMSSWKSRHQLGSRETLDTKGLQ
ncbi:hypothetical protein B0T24DRAFT_207890 [Lasiosphaeria ovina]|uniref:Uncharacterized protein n=1 Tax=Lasiosphaeria ovina TaxID=92902 RepID=A0AAE0KG49_9PEZI|nr:hypothetical protein B0T24DRAFT_207890 [Lasiosphaeria ovina]